MASSEGQANWRAPLLDAAAREKAGLDKGRTFRCLIHRSFGAICAMIDVPLAVVVAIIQHANSEMLLEVYVKFGKTALTQSLDRFGSSK